MEKKTKLKALTNLAAAGVIIGVMLFSGSKTAVNALIAGAMIIASGIACVLFEDILDELEKEREDLEEEPETKENGTFDYIYQQEYTFTDYLLDKHFSYPDFLDYIDDAQDPKEAFEKAYADYVKSARSKKVQPVELVQDFIWRERRRRDG